MKNLFLQTLRKIRSSSRFSGRTQVERAFGDRIPEDGNRRGRSAGEKACVETPVRIRAMQIEDLEQVQAIDSISFSMPWPLSSYRFELLENPSSMLWVAETSLPEGKTVVVGMVVVWMIMEEAHIATIAVHPDFRGRGIGRQLLACSLQEAILKGASQATLEVRVGNVVAQNLYREFGFQAVGRRPKYYQDNFEDALIMTAFGLSQAWMDRLARESAL
jgi:ribosomal-protein-alanine N-acetyltransferase